MNHWRGMMIHQRHMIRLSCKTLLLLHIRHRLLHIRHYQLHMLLKLLRKLRHHDRNQLSELRQ